MDKLVINLLVIVALLMFTGCATITRGTTEAYNVTSVPSGALVSFSTGETCTTPCVLEKKRNQPFVVNIVKEGYEPVDIQVSTETCSEVASTTIANLAMIGSVIWCSLDAILGATQDLFPNPGVATLVPLANYQGG
jgi:hypothetical protein